MDPVLAQALAGLISAAATVLLMAGTWYFGRNGHAKRPDDTPEPDEE